MKNSLIAPSDKLGYSDIFLDFVTGADKAKPFYPAGSFANVIDKIDKRSYPRDQLVEILVEQNKMYNASPETFDNISKLSETTTLTIFSGQQAGLFGGSLLILFKAFSLVKAAAEYSRQLNRTVLPIFWIAGDDHDYEEVNHTFLLNKQGEVVKISYDTTPKIALPTAELTFNDISAITEVKNIYKETLGDSDFTPELYELLDKAYTPDDTYVTAFGKMMVALTKHTGLIFFSPGDPAAKKLAQPLFEQIIQCQDELHQRLAVTNNNIESAGYHLQVEKKENSAHLFYNKNGRRAMLSENGSFSTDDATYSKQDVLSEVKAHPERFSPDVFTRPILQSYLFPVLSQKGGAAEIAYLAQINQIFDLFDVPVPYYKARPTATIVEKRFQKILDEYEIAFEEITGDIEQLINRILEKSFPDNIEQSFEKFRNHIRCHFEDFSDETLQFDPTLKKFSEQTMGKIDFTIKAFEGKVFSSHKKKSQDSRDRIYRLEKALYPNRTFQERVLNIGYFISKYGFGIVDYISEQLDSEECAHRLIKLSEFNQS